MLYLIILISVYHSDVMKILMLHLIVLISVYQSDVMKIPHVIFDCSDQCIPQ